MSVEPPYMINQAQRILDLVPIQLGGGGITIGHEGSAVLRGRVICSSHTANVCWWWDPGFPSHELSLAPHTSAKYTCLCTSQYFRSFFKMQNHGSILLFFEGKGSVTRYSFFLSKWNMYQSARKITIHIPSSTSATVNVLTSSLSFFSCMIMVSKITN